MDFHRIDEFIVFMNSFDEFTFNMIPYNLKIQFVYSMNSFTPSSFHLISEFIYIGIFHMPTSHIFVVENGV